jgi:hypothetical protein
MSWGGESGSPVFVYDEHVRVSNPGALYETSGGLYEIQSLQRNDVVASEVSPWLLGVLYGDFGMPVEVKQNGTQIGGVDVNAGISVVIPSDDLRTLLMHPALVEARNKLTEYRESLIAKPSDLPEPQS